MGSTAISAQGSKLEVGTATGTAKTITAVQVGNPTIFTSNAHGLANGDIITLAGLVGTISVMNGMTLVVHNVTANTFAVDYDSTSLAYTSGGTATPVTWTKISNLKTYNGFDGQASEIDVSNLDSTAKEFRLGLVDNGQLSLDVDYNLADAGQAACDAARIASAAKSFKLTLPDASTATFTAYVKKFARQGGVDAVIKGTLDLRISGAVTWA